MLIHPSSFLVKHLLPAEQGGRWTSACPPTGHGFQTHPSLSNYFSSRSSPETFFDVDPDHLYWGKLNSCVEICFYFPIGMLNFLENFDLNPCAKPMREFSTSYSLLYPTLSAIGVVLRPTDFLRMIWKPPLKTKELAPRTAQPNENFPTAIELRT